MHMFVILPLVRYFPDTFNRLWTPVLFMLAAVAVCYLLSAMIERTRQLKWLILLK